LRPRRQPGEPPRAGGERDRLRAVGDVQGRHHDQGGAVEQSNFTDFEVLRIDEMPVVEVHIVPSTEKPTGIGEPALPPIAPAVANALFAATGKRLRRLPITRQDLA
jgi:CO/xanthine dehydrogenase Mo-binding subunit